MYGQRKVQFKTDDEILRECKKSKTETGSTMKWNHKFSIKRYQIDVELLLRVMSKNHFNNIVINKMLQLTKSNYLPSQINIWTE